MNLSGQLHGWFRLAFGKEGAHVFLLWNWYACTRAVNGRTGQFGLLVVFHTNSGASLIFFLEATKLTNLARNGKIRTFPPLWITVENKTIRKPPMRCGSVVPWRCYMTRPWFIPWPWYPCTDDTWSSGLVGSLGWAILLHVSLVNGTRTPAR